MEFFETESEEHTGIVSNALIMEVLHIFMFEFSSKVSSTSDSGTEFVKNAANFSINGWENFEVKQKSLFETLEM